MKTFVVALRKEMLEQWRTYRLLIVAVVLVLFGLTSPLLARYTPEALKLLPNGEQIAQFIPAPTVQDAVAQYLKNMSQFGLILGLLMAMGAVSQEKEKGTAALMLVKPFPRGAFLLAKFVSLGATFAISLAVAGLGCWYYTLLLFEALDPARWLALNALLLLFTLVYVALTLFASTVTRSQAAAGGLALGLIMVLSIPGALPKIGEYLPGQLVNWGGALAMGVPGTQPAWPAVWISLGLIAASLAGAWLAFRRQEL